MTTKKSPGLPRGIKTRGALLRNAVGVIELFIRADARSIPDDMRNDMLAGAHEAAHQVVNDYYRRQLYLAGRAPQAREDKPDPDAPDSRTLPLPGFEQKEAAQ